MNICIPFISIESLADKLTLQYRFSGTKKTRDNTQEKMRDMMMKVRAPLTACLGKVQFTIQELLNLKHGDVILLNKPINEELEVRVADQKKFMARPGLRNRKKAIQITRSKSND
jgi:flagellar motor switch protein FliM